MSRKKSNKLVRWHWEVSPEVERSISAVVLIALGVLFGMAYFGSAGVVGRYLDAGLGFVFGLDRFIVSIVFIGLGLTLLFRGHLRATVLLGAFFSLLSLNALVQIITIPAGATMPMSAGGGALGLFLANPLVKMLSLSGAVVILCAILIAGLVLIFDASLASFGEALKFITIPFRKLFAPAASTLPKQKPTTIKGIDDSPVEEPEEKPEEDEEEEEQEEEKENLKTKTAAVPEPVFTVAPLPRRIHRRIEIPLDLLETKSGKASAGDIRANQEVIRRTLEQFNIPVEMGDVSVGPTVTQYTLKPSEGVKLSKIINLSNDLALALAAHPIRIEAPIPGKSLVGIEVPNQTVAIVKIREGVEAPNFHLEKHILPIVLGKDVAGEPWVADVTRMPHMLVAGATGSGKTVCLNTIIVSLLFRLGPDDLKFIMIDPKRVELPCYNGIPHLLTPVITEVPKIVNSLKWCITEMERRFDLLAKLGRRDIASYNKEVDETIKKNPESPLSRLPYIVVVIDELADLMATSSQEVEGSIVRLAQLARAIGIHLIVATQRPSVDVITGLIKANITTRIAFAVATSTDSRTIIDTSGAEKLLGRGDMLYTTAELSKPKRIQGAYVNDEEIRRVVEYLKSHADGEPEYRTDIVDRPKAMGPSGESYDDSEDDLLPEARDLVVAAGKASASLLQRRLKVGYARAARLLDLMETQGVIGPGDGAKPRAILVKRSTAGIPTPGDESAGSVTIFADEISEPSDDDDKENI